MPEGQPALPLKKLQANLPKILLLNFFHMFLVIMPVIVPYWQSYGLGMTDVFFLQGAFAVGVVVWEVPSGYISDLLGRKNTIVTAGLISGVAFLIFVNSTTLGGFFVFELLMSVAVSLFSGTDVALIYDTMEQLPERKHQETAILGQKIFYSQIGETIAALLGGALAVYSFALPAYVQAVAAWMPFLIGLSLYDPPRQKMQSHRHRENFRYIFRSLFGQSRLLNLIILNLVVYGAATLLVVWAFQGYWKQIGIPLPYFGYLWAGYNLSVALVGRAAHRWERRLGAPAVVVLIGLLPVAGYFGMGASASWLGVFWGFLFQVCRGLSGVILLDALNSRVSADMRATANSIASLGIRLSFALVGPLLGWVIDRSGYSLAFYMMGGLYVVVFFLVNLPLLAQRRFFKPPA